jgi:opacity protein-like surface antigen
MMKFCLSIVALVLLLPCAVNAQDYPKAEVYGGYQLLRNAEDVETVNFHGFQAAVEGNLTQYFGLVGEFGLGVNTLGQEITGAPVDVRVKQYTFLAGPRVSYRTEKVRVFGHALFGGDRIDGGASFEGVSAGIAITPFTMAFGGGIDFSVNDRISIRAAQFDYMTSRATLLDLTAWMNQFRYSGGLVIKFGGDYE